MRYDAEHKDRIRALLLKEAARAIRSEGPQRIGVAAIMARVGLTHGGFYAHFRSKDALIAEAVATMFSETTARLDRALADKPAGDALASYVDFYLSARHRDDRGRGCPIPALSAEAPHLSGAGRKAFAAGIKQLTARLADLLRDVGESRAEDAARSLLSELVGAVALARSIGRGEQSDAVLAASRAALMQRYRLQPHEDS